MLTEKLRDMAGWDNEALISKLQDVRNLMEDAAREIDALKEEQLEYRHEIRDLSNEIRQLEGEVEDLNYR